MFHFISFPSKILGPVYGGSSLSRSLSLISLRGYQGIPRPTEWYNLWVCPRVSSWIGVPETPPKRSIHKVFQLWLDARTNAHGASCMDPSPCWGSTFWLLVFCNLVLLVTIQNSWIYWFRLSALLSFLHIGPLHHYWCLPLPSVNLTLQFSHTCEQDPDSLEFLSLGQQLFPDPEWEIHPFMA